LLHTGSLRLAPASTAPEQQLGHSPVAWANVRKGNGLCRAGQKRDVRGPEALATFIDAQFQLYPGISIVSSAAEVLGDRAWFRWSATLGTGESFHGVDFVEFAPDGRIARLTGFYEP
jgi:hypothetical protein